MIRKNKKNGNGNKRLTLKYQLQYFTILTQLKIDAFHVDIIERNSQMRDSFEKVKGIKEKIKKKKISKNSIESDYLVSPWNDNHKWSREQQKQSIHLDLIRNNV